MGSKANQNLISSQTLAFPPFSPLFFLKNKIAHIMSPKTTFLAFIFPLKCKALFGLHPLFIISHFFYLFGLKSLIPHKPLFDHPINPIFHFSLLLYTLAIYLS